MPGEREKHVYVILLPCCMFLIIKMFLGFWKYVFSSSVMVGTFSICILNLPGKEGNDTCFAEAYEIPNLYGLNQIKKLILRLPSDSYFSEGNIKP